MSELTIEQIIKVALVVAVVVIVVLGLYIFFKGQVFDFFGGLPNETQTSSSGTPAPITTNNVPQPLHKCGDCGRGFFNLCDKNECDSISTYLIKFKTQNKIQPPAGCNFVNGQVLNDCIDIQNP